MSLLERRDYFKPLAYGWAFEAYETQQKMHWIPSEVSLHEDVKDWNTRLSLGEKNLLTQLFRFFTQADIDIAKGYIDRYLPLFKPPEIRMMLTAFANVESIHVHGYSLLLDTIGMPEAEYKAFQEYEDMAAKHEYLESVKFSSKEDIAKNIAVYSAFGEGLQLFSSFAMLLNFPRTGKMKGMGQIVSWSLKDEDLHVMSMIKLFHTFVDENPRVWTASLKQDLREICSTMVHLEDKFIDLAYGQGEIEGLTSREVKEYIRYTADKRLIQLGLDPMYKVKDNPLPWLDWMMGGESHQNFFEGREVSYSKGALKGDWGEVWKMYDK